MLFSHAGGSGRFKSFNQLQQMRKKLDGDRDVIRPGSAKMGNVKFSDVAGMNEAKQEVRKYYLKKHLSLKRLNLAFFTRNRRSGWQSNNIFPRLAGY